MKQFIYIIGIAALFLLEGCSSVKTAAYQDYPTQCLGKGMDGTQMLKVWAVGKNRHDALEQAKKKAVYVMLFEGITGTASDCDTRPIIVEANARSKYEEYFDVFFSKGGEYTKYVERVKPHFYQRAINKQKGQYFKNDGIIVSVNRSALKRKLIADNIIKQ